MRNEVWSNPESPDQGRVGVAMLRIARFRNPKIYLPGLYIWIWESEPDEGQDYREWVQELIVIQRCYAVGICEHASHSSVLMIHGLGQSD